MSSLLCSHNIISHIILVFKWLNGHCIGPLGGLYVQVSLHDEVQITGAKVSPCRTPAVMSNSFVFPRGDITLASVLVYILSMGLRKLGRILYALRMIFFILTRWMESNAFLKYMKVIMDGG